MRRRYQTSNSLIAGLLIVLTLSCPGQAAEKAQSAVVGPEGATIYSAPDFDAQVLMDLPPGEKIVISRRPYPGQGGLGIFYRAKARNRLGYVTDVDVIPQYKRDVKTGKRKVNPIYETVEDAREMARSGQKEIFYTRYIGGGLGYLGFSEKFGGRKLQSDVLMYNLKFTGPGVLLDAAPLDLNIAFSPSAPSYYDKLSNGPASGFFAFGDLSFDFPGYEKSNFLFYYGFGLMWTYTKFRVQVNLTYVDSQELRMGFDGMLGAALRLKKWVVRIESKFYYEKTQYLGHWLSLQHEY